MIVAPKVEEVGLSLKEVKLGGVEIGLVIDEVIKSVLPPGKQKIYINKVIVLDGFSNRRVNLETGIRNKLTVVDTGKVSHGTASKTAHIRDELVDIGSKMLGGSMFQLRKLGTLVLKSVGIPLADQTSEYIAELKIKGKKVGQATYSTVKYHKLRELPAISALVVDKDLHDEVLGMPVIISNSVIEIDLTQVNINEDGLVELVARENLDVGQLSQDHGRNVVVKVFYEITIPIEGELPHKKLGTLEIDLGQFTFHTLKTDRSISSDEL
jgi:hypothetical protein